MKQQLNRDELNGLILVIAVLSGYLVLHEIQPEYQQVAGSIVFGVVWSLALLINLPIERR